MRVGRDRTLAEAEARLRKSEELLMQTRETIGGLKAAMASMRRHLDELDAELHPEDADGTDQS